MRLLVDFLCRFGWGLSVALVLTPSSLVPAGFFRVNMLVVLGLATFAALLCGQPLPAHTWLLPAAAAVTAWMASIVWFAERKRPGIVLCLITAVLLAAATCTTAVAAASNSAVITHSAMPGRVRSANQAMLDIHAVMAATAGRSQA